MENLFQTQIHQGCKLALPDGLKELMADISREVLRAQPENLYKFISDYLAALLVTREHLNIACLLCGDVCDGFCRPTMVEELRTLGLSEEAEKAAEIIVTYFEEGGYKEDDVMPDLIKSTSITEKQLPAVRQAIEKAFLKQKLKDAFPHESSSDFSMDSITRAVQHTMKLYEKTKPTQEEYASMASKIQEAYRGYGVRRQTLPSKTSRPKPSNFSHGIYFSDQQSGDSCCQNFDSPKISTSSLTPSDQKPLHLPFYIMDHDDLSDLMEKENNNFDYTSDHNIVETKNCSLFDDKIKKISFSSPACSDMIDYDDDGDDESTHSKSYFAEDTKIMDDAIAELDENVTNEFKGDNDTLIQNDLEPLKLAYESLTEIKESKRFVADDGPELGDKVEHCHITITADTGNAMARNNFVADNSTTRQNNRSIKSIDSTNVIAETSKSKKQIISKTEDGQFFFDNLIETDPAEIDWIDKSTKKSATDDLIVNSYATTDGITNIQQNTNDSESPFARDQTIDTIKGEDTISIENTYSNDGNIGDSKMMDSNVKDDDSKAHDGTLTPQYDYLKIKVTPKQISYDIFNKEENNSVGSADYFTKK